MLNDPPKTLSMGSTQRWATVRDCEKATLRAFNGRTGNNVAAVAHVLAAAWLLGIKRVHFPVNNLNVWRHIFGVIPVFDFIDLELSSGTKCNKPIDPEGKCFNLQDEPTFHIARGQGYLEKWWNLMCAKATAKDYHDVFARYLHPMLTPECKRAMAAQASRKDSLTIHLRADDLFDSDKKPGKFNNRFFQQAPCGLFEKIIRDGGYKRVLIVTDPGLKHPCVKWALDNPLATLGVTVGMHSKSVWEDYCTLAGSTNVVASSSSFAHTAAVLGAPRNIYVFGDITTSRHWLLDCDTAPGTTVWQYKLPLDATKKYARSTKGINEFFRTYPWQEVLGPLPCEHKKEKHTVAEHSGS